MKHLLITTIAAVLVVGCDEAQPPESPTAKAPDISIHVAAGTGYIEGVKQHLAAGTDVNAQNEDGQTPLHRAVSVGKFAGKKETVELLIDKGADVNAKTYRVKATPLHYAAASSHKEVSELLIAKGADVNAKNVDGETPLDWSDDENADLLRKHGGKTGEELKAEGK